jgi:signal recognition particle subunit SRP54
MGNLKELGWHDTWSLGKGNEKPMDIDDDAFKGIEAIIQSMTPQERESKSRELLNGSRRKRIAAGSGTTSTRRKQS